MSKSTSPNHRQAIYAYDPILGNVFEVQGTTANGAINVNATASLAGSPIPISGALTAVGVAIVDGSGNQITSFGGGTQYTDGGVPPAHPVGNTIEWSDGSNWQTVSSAKPLPVTASFSPSGTQDVNLTKIAGTTTSVNSGPVDSGTIRVTVASDSTGQIKLAAGSAAIGSLIAGTALIGKVGIDQTTPGTTNAVAVTNFPTTVDTNSGNKSASTLRVILATDQPQLTNKLLVTPDSVALPANQSVNISQINAVTPLMGNGTTGTGSQRVTIASDNTAFAVNATLSAETTKAIGVVRNSDGAGNLWTSNSTTFTAKFAQDTNLLGTLGTAFSTAGKVDIKGADGDVFVRQATGSNLHTVLDSGTLTTLTGTTTLTPGTGATNLGKAEDAVHGSGDVGVLALGTRQDTPASTAGSSGDYQGAAYGAEGGQWSTMTPSATGGWTTYHLVSANSTNATNLKASVGTVGGWFIYNSNAAARKVAFHNTAGSPTAGASIFFAIVIPPSSGANVEFTNGIAFSTGIAITTVTGLADSDNTAVAANDLIINIWLK